jgi:AhpD family alkylhydroperoxidase
MPARLDYNALAPEGLKAMRALDQYVRQLGLEPGLVEFVKLRASLMNGCSYCVDLHAREARAQGETERRLFAVPVWRETPFFTPRERAALAWTEAVTHLGRDGVNDALYDEVCAHFSEKVLVDLTVAVIAINAWNRLAVPFRSALSNHTTTDAPAVTTA